MRKKLILTNVVLLLISLAMCLGVSLYISRRNVVSNSQKNLYNYSNLVKNDIINGSGLDFDKYELVEKNLRTTVINVLSEKNVVVFADSAYQEDKSSLNEVDWLSLKEFKEIETYVVRKDDTLDGKKMLYYTFKINNTGYDQYIRVGVPYDELFEDNTSLIIITIIFTIVIFAIMSFVMGQSIYQGIKPINKVIGNITSKISKMSLKRLMT